MIALSSKCLRWFLPKKSGKGDKYVANEEFLNPDIFINQFYKPANDLLGSSLTGFIFEQEYQRKDERLPVVKIASALDTFFKAIPPDTRYHIELRTETYLTNPVFEVLEKHGVGQVLSHWTWLPTLKNQWLKSGERFFNKGKEIHYPPHDPYRAEDMKMPMPRHFRSTTSLKE